MAFFISFECVHWCYLNSLIWGSREQQVSSGVHTQTPDRTLVANKCPLTLEDLLGVVCYIQAKRQEKLDMYFHWKLNDRGLYLKLKLNDKKGQRSRWREDKGRKKSQIRQSDLKFPFQITNTSMMKLFKICSSSLQQFTKCFLHWEKRTVTEHRQADTYSPRFPCWAWHWCGTTHPTDTQIMNRMLVIRWLSNSNSYIHLSPFLCLHTHLR